jgi:hypothetical protein
MSIDERLEALTMNLELAFRDIESQRQLTQELRELAKQDGEHIRGLVRIAELHDKRLSRLEKEQ